MWFLVLGFLGVASASSIEYAPGEMGDCPSVSPYDVVKVGSEVTESLTLPTAEDCPGYTVDLSEASGLELLDLPDGVCPTPGTSVKVGPNMELQGEWQLIDPDENFCKDFTLDMSNAIGLTHPDYPAFSLVGICPTPGTSIKLGSGFVGWGTYPPTATQCSNYTMDLSDTSIFDLNRLFDLNPTVPQGVCFTPGTCHGGILYTEADLDAAVASAVNSVTASNFSKTQLMDAYREYCE